MKIKWLLLLVLCIGLLINVQAKGIAEWTVMVYMAADNDLEYFALKDLNEMEKVGSSDKLNIVALVDRWDGYEWKIKNGKVVRVKSNRDYTGNGDWTDTRILYITKDNDPNKINSKVLVKGYEINTGDPKNLEEFIVSAAKVFPAKKYLVIVWNHGGGIQGIAWDESVDGNTWYDDKDHIPAPVLGKIFAKAVAKIAQKNKDIIDVVGFDACLMDMYEIANDLGKNNVKTMVGSEELEPGNGWPYDKFLAYLKNRIDKGEDVDGDSVAQNIVREFVKSYSGIHAEDATLAAVSLKPDNKFDAINAKINELCEALMENDDNMLKLHTAAKETQKYDFWTYYVDMIDLMKNIADEFSDNKKIKAAALGVINEIKKQKLIIANDHTGRKVKDSNGISIYFPLYQRKKDENGNPYLEQPLSEDKAKILKFYFGKKTKWVDMLQKYYDVLNKKSDKELAEL